MHLISIVKRATEKDAENILSIVLSTPGFLAEGENVDMAWMLATIAGTPVFIGQYGLFICHRFTNVSWIIHPRWKGPGSGDAMAAVIEALGEEGGTTFLGFVPSYNSRALDYFLRCGFALCGEIPGSLRKNGKLHSQFIVSKGG